MSTEACIRLHFEYINPKEDLPSMANLGDIFKEFQSAFNACATLDEKEGERIPLKVMVIRSGSIILDICSGVYLAIESLVTIAKLVASCWKNYNASDEAKFLNDLQLPNVFEGNLIKKSPNRKTIIEKYGNKLTKEQIDRATVADHINRAKYWKITIVEINGEE